ncbi:hypothetical protein ABZ484_38450 [Streptomyces sp. NPDC006393]|uniref:hypothetical protein n=1 Tax=Streptomyces sp. NPDC006393 TaxID=3156763 RepID=UPI0033E4A0AA
MPTRTFVVTAAGVGAAVLAAAGITYAATTDSAPAKPSAHRAAPSVHRAAAPAQRPARPAQRPAAPEAPSGRGGGGEKDEGRDRDDGGRGRGHEEQGRIYFNERTYSATGEGCVTAASGLGSSSFSIFNDSKWTVEVFRGFTCDNGSPVATVGPHGATNGVVTSTVQGGLFGDDGVVGSFRVLRDYDEW